MYHRKRVSTSVEIWERELYNGMWNNLRHNNTNFSAAAPIQRKLIFLYLANDIIQTSRKKGVEFIKGFGPVLHKTIVHTFRYFIIIFFQKIVWPQAVPQMHKAKWLLFVCWTSGMKEKCMTRGWLTRSKPSWESNQANLSLSPQYT